MILHIFNAFICDIMDFDLLFMFCTLMKILKILKNHSGSNHLNALIKDFQLDRDDPDRSHVSENSQLSPWS